MKTLKEEFEKEIKANKDGISVLFETSNQKYIEWLENKIAKILSPSEPEQKKPDCIIEFIEEIEWMRGLYQNQRYTSAEQLRDQLAEKLDDIMRIKNK